MAGIAKTDVEALIETQVADEIFQGVTTESKALSMFRRLPNMTSDKTKLRVLDSLPVAYFVDETQDNGRKNITKQAWANKYINAAELAVIIPIKENLLNDADVDLWAEIRPQLTNAIAKAVDDAIFNGTGAPQSWGGGIIPAILSKSKGIKTAVHAGDLIQSTFSNVQKKYTNEDRQIEYLLSTYPTGLDNYILLGNHDLNTVKKDGHYLEMMGSRDDFHIMGIKTSYLNWQGHPISLYHRCDKYRMPIESLKTVLNLKGHSHTLKWSQSGTISVPSLSDDMFEHNCSLPGFLIGNLEDDCITIDSYYYYKDSLRERPKILTKRIK